MTNLACVITFLLWKPDPEQLYLFFVLPALWGMADAVWQPQVNGKSGTAPNEGLISQSKESWPKVRQTERRAGGGVSNRYVTCGLVRAGWKDAAESGFLFVEMKTDECAPSGCFGSMLSGASSSPCVTTKETK